MKAPKGTVRALLLIHATWPCVSPQMSSFIIHRKINAHPSWLGALCPGINSCVKQCTLRTLHLFWHYWIEGKKHSGHHWNSFVKGGTHFAPGAASKFVSPFFTFCALANSISWKSLWFISNLDQAAYKPCEMEITLLNETRAIKNGWKPSFCLPVTNGKTVSFRFSPPSPPKVKK